MRAAIIRAGVKHEQIGPPEMGGHGTLPVHGRTYKFICCFVRNPLDWYRSYWAYRMQGGWRPTLLIDRQCQSDDFDQFIRNCSGRLPGILSQVYELYTGPNDAPIDFIGRQEHLADDIVRALHLAGESFDEAALRDTPKANQTYLKPSYNEVTRELVLLSEYRAVRRHGYLIPSDLGYIRDILERFSEDADALCRFAIRTEITHIESDAARQRQGKSVTAITRTRYARTLGNFALYFNNIKSNTIEAEALFRRALEFDPDHPRTLGNLASFLENVRGDYDEAEKLYHHALEVRPKHAGNLGMFAAFMERVRSSHDEAESLYYRAVEADPNHAPNLSNWALFLNNVRRDYTQAAQYFERSLAVDPENIQSLVNYAELLYFNSERYNEADELYQRAIALRPSDGRILANYGLFLVNARQEYARAEEIFRRAAAALPDNKEIHEALHQVEEMNASAAVSTK